MGITDEKRAEQLPGNYRESGWITERQWLRWSQQKDRKWEKGRRIKNVEARQRRKTDWRNKIPDV